MGRTNVVSPRHGGKKQVHTNGQSDGENNVFCATGQDREREEDRKKGKGEWEKVVRER